MISLRINRQGDTAVTTPAFRKLLRQAAKQTLAQLHINEAVEISLLLTDNQNIQVFNRDYRGIDAVTDVLSFAMEEGEDIVVMEDEPRLLGDIIVSRQRAAEQAKAYGHSLQREEAFLFIHGLLHLLGYDHEQGMEEEKIMFALQDEIIATLNISSI